MHEAQSLPPRQAACCRRRQTGRDDDEPLRSFIDSDADRRVAGDRTVGEESIVVFHRSKWRREWPCWPRWLPPQTLPTTRSFRPLQCRSSRCEPGSVRPPNSCTEDDRRSASGFLHARSRSPRRHRKPQERVKRHRKDVLPRQSPPDFGQLLNAIQRGVHRHSTRRSLRRRWTRPRDRPRNP